MHAEKTIRHLFWDKTRNYEIPSYQRAYSWEKPQLEQFIQDLQETESQYYLGHFIFENPGAADISTLHVVDGQQRLTTLVIFWIALRRVLKDRCGNSSAIDLDELEDFCIKDIKKDRLRLQTVEEDCSFFRDHVISNIPEKPERKSQQRMAYALDFFIKQLSKTESDEIARWHELILNAEITENVVTEKVKATRIFAFQNDRGKELTKLEIVKAYFMLRIQISGLDEAAKDEAISYIENHIARIYSKAMAVHLSEDDVLSYFWRSYSDKGFDADEPVAGVKGKVSELGKDSIEWAKGFMRDLAKAFTFVAETETSDDPYVQDLLFLNSMALSYPFLMKASRLGADGATMKRLFRLLENLTFRSMLRGGRAGIARRLNSHLRDLNETSDVIPMIGRIVANIKQDGDWWYWSDDSVKSVLNGWFYGNPVDNYLLWKYELQISNPNHPRPHNVSLSDLIWNESIEHIAPKTENDDHVAGGYGIYEDKENPTNGIVSGEWMNRLGNLMLISQSHNSSIGNKPFSEKLQSYGRDNLLNQQKEITRFASDIGGNPLWDVSAIHRRHEEIVNTSLSIWSLDKLVS